jgi:O-antigen/teichoic acid export membrane protein
MHPFFIKSLADQSYITQFSSPGQLLIQLKFIPLSVRPAIFPTLARKAEEDNDVFQNYSTSLMKFLYIVALPLIILLVVARNEVLPLVTSLSPSFKQTYALALQIYPLIGWSVALSFPSQVLRSLFVALKKPEFEFRTVLAGVIVLAILEVVLILKYGVIGAGYASIACEWTILIYGFWLLEKIGRPVNVMNLFLLPTLCGIIISLLAEYLYRIHWLFGVVLVVVGFPALVLILKVISPAEWAIVREVIKPGSTVCK